MDEMAAHVYAAAFGLASFAPLPSLLLANVRSLVNNMDYLLRLWIINNKRITDTTILIFTESWLHEGVPDSAIALLGLHCTRSDRTADCGKMRGGGLLLGYQLM